MDIDFAETEFYENCPKCGAKVQICHGGKLFARCTNKNCSYYISNNGTDNRQNKKTFSFYINGNIWKDFECNCEFIHTKDINFIHEEVEEAIRNYIREMIDREPNKTETPENYFVSSNIKTEIFLDDDLRKQFHSECKRLNENENLAFEKAVKKYSDEILKSKKKEIANKKSSDVGKVIKKIPKWAKKPDTMIHKVIKSYFEAEKKQGEGKVTKRQMKILCNEKDRFDATFNSLISHNSANGKVFEKEYGYIMICDNIKNILLEYKNNFLNSKTVSISEKTNTTNNDLNKEIIDLHINPYTVKALKDLKVGQIAQEKLRKILTNGDISEQEIEKMQTLEYSKKTFGLQYPLLVKADSYFEKVRYYKNPLYIRGKEYRLCSQWFETPANNDRWPLIKWIDNYRKKYEEYKETHTYISNSQENP